MSSKKFCAIGTNPRRKDGAAKVTGTEQYAPDVSIPACGTAVCCAALMHTRGSSPSIPRQRR